MEETEMKGLWIQSPRSRSVKIDVNKLVENLDKKISTMEKTVKQRDKMEIFLAVLMIGLFTWWLIVVRLLIVKIGAVSILAGCILVTIKLLRAKKTNIKQDGTADVNYYLTVSLQLVKNQIKLQETILWWYLLPFYCGIECFFFAYINSVKAIAVYSLFTLLLYGYIWYVNKKSVRVHLKPLAKNVTEALNQLSGSELS